MHTLLSISHPFKRFEYEVTRDWRWNSVSKKVDGLGIARRQRIVGGEAHGIPGFACAHHAHPITIDYCPSRSRGDGSHRAVNASAGEA